jgi:UDP-glucose 4-epimerase
MKIVIFGGNGFIGKHLTNFLKDNKHSVYSFGNKKYSIQKKNLFYYNKNNFKKIINQYKPDSIFFLSGNSYPNNSKNETDDINSNNLHLQQLLQSLVETHYKKLFFYTSSTSIYGSLKNKKNIHKDYKFNPQSFYSLSKLFAEQQIKYYSDNFNINSVILRLSSIYGQGLKRQVIFKILKNSRTKKLIHLVGWPNDSRQFLYINDLVLIIYKLINKKILKGFNLFNITNQNSTKINQIIKIVEKIRGKKINVKYDKKNESPKILKLSNLKIKKFIRFNKFTSLSLGLKKTIDWIDKT